MLSERSYMRTEYPRERTSVLTWLLCAMVGGFVLQILLELPGFGGPRVLVNDFGLSVHALRHGWIWTLATHAFLSDLDFSIFHVAVAAAALFLVGRELLPLIGARRFLGLFFGSTVAGGLAWTLVHWRLGGAHVGAMAAVDAMLVVFACFYPNRQLDFLFLFVFPVRVRPKHIVWILFWVDAIGLIAYEILGAARPFEELPLAHSAHLGGMLAGWIYFRFVHEARWLGRARRGGRAPLASPETAEPVDGAAAADVKSQRNLRAEVDRVLDKINSHGFASLTPQEKRVLDEARDLLSR